MGRHTLVHMGFVDKSNFMKLGGHTLDCTPDVEKFSLFKITCPMCNENWFENDAASCNINVFHKP